MKLLLDTHAALWWWDDAAALGRSARKLMSEREHQIHFSAASAYEIQQKVRLGRLQVPSELMSQGLAKAVAEEGWIPLPLSLSEASDAASIEHPHRDPFDRMIAAQALSGGLVVLSRDPAFPSFGVEVIW